ncbi:MAG: VTT domain-containing protein [Candidatus Bathyarchaeia archaeon]|nr:VTT domain-containing protein [Candidatus Bathyarchaeota archaeon]
METIETLLESIPFSQIASWLRDIALKYGYLGILLVSFLGSLSIILPIPYAAVIFMMGGWFEPNLLALSAGVGSALGEILGYVIGYYGGSLISEERRRKMEPIVKIFMKYGAIAVFIFALTPLPDDLLIIPLGIMRLPLIKVFLPCALGKIGMCFILAYGGRFLKEVIEWFIVGEEGDLLLMAVTGILLIAIVIAILKIDWENLLLEGGYKIIFKRASKNK